MVVEPGEREIEGEDLDPDGFTGWFRDVLVSWGPALLAVLLLRSMVAEPFRIPSGSMVPTLAIGDHILVTKYSYGLRYPLTRIPVTEIQVPDRGDVVVFVFPKSDTGTVREWLDLPIPGVTTTLDYVKRVVGLPGETVEVRDNVVYIDGEAQTKTMTEQVDFVDVRCRPIPSNAYEEDLEGTSHALLNSRYGMHLRDYPPTVVPPGHVFVMGDNRDHSQDSRVWGFVPLRNLKGKARFIWFSYDQCEPGLWMLGRIRTERFFEAIR